MTAYYTTNRDPSNGIRYGVISQGLIGQAWADSAEPEYPCGECDCEEEFRESGDCDAEPDCYAYDAQGYVMVTCLDSDVMICKSPFFTFAPLCSPCVPNAGNLDGAAEWFEGELPTGYDTYCVGHDWFEDGVAPYPVFGMVSCRPCFPDAWYGHNINWQEAQEKYGEHWYGHDTFRMPSTAVVSDYCANPHGWHSAG